MIDSRAVRDGKGVRRRRECASCGHRYTTYEFVDAVALLVVKRDGRREPYQRDKIRQGVLQACRKRPITAEQIEALVDRVESRLARVGGEEIGAPEIGRLVMGELRELDPVAYVRFASVYRRFDSVDAFIEIVEGMAQVGSEAREEEAEDTAASERTAGEGEGPRVPDPGEEARQEPTP